MKRISAILCFLVMSTTCLSACEDNNNTNTTTRLTKITETQNQTTVAEIAISENTVGESDVTTEAGKESAENKEVYMTNNNICTQDEYEQTLFCQPISVERNGEMRLGIKCTHDSYAELTIYEAQDGKYVPLFSCTAMIGKNGPAKHAEGDTKTPLGTWEIGEAYGIKDDPGSLLPYTKINDDMYWCATGNYGKKYNKLIYRSDDPEADYSEDEHLIDYPIRYSYLIDLGYNKACVPYAGNAIFLHCWKEPDYPTGGCVAVSEENMITILKTIKPGTVVTIY